MPRKLGNGPGHGGSANGKYQPFEPGHEVTVVHGVRSRTNRYIGPMAQALVEVLLSDRPDLNAYPEAVMAWAVAEARCERYRQWHEQVGLFDSDGNVRGGHYVGFYEGQAQRLRERLGLDPMSDAQLQRSRSEAILSTVDLESIRQRGREALARRQHAPAAAPVVQNVEVEE